MDLSNLTKQMEREARMLREIERENRVLREIEREARVLRETWMEDEFRKRRALLDEAEQFRREAQAAFEAEEMALLASQRAEEAGRARLEHFLDLQRAEETERRRLEDSLDVKHLEHLRDLEREDQKWLQVQAAREAALAMSEILPEFVRSSSRVFAPTIEVTATVTRPEAEPRSDEDEAQERGFVRKILLVLFTPLPNLRNRSMVQRQPAAGAWLGIAAKVFFRGAMLEAFRASQLDIQDDVFAAESELERHWCHLRGRYYLFALFFWRPVSKLIEIVAKLASRGG